MITLQQDTIYMGTAAPASGGGGSGDAVWGSITGTLANQTDLAAALAGKQDVIDANNKLNASYVSGLATVAATGAYSDLNGTPDLSTYVTTDTEQNITSAKTFIGGKKILLKQNTSSDRPGFTVYDRNGLEIGAFEASTSNNRMTIGTPNFDITKVGFRNWGSSKNLYMPNIRVTGSDFYIPVVITDGTTMVTTASTGVLDISSLIPTYSAFGGATGSVAGSMGLVPAPAATDNDKYLKGDGTWAAVSGGGLQNGATGSFTSQDGKTVTVTNGVITSIA